MSSLSKLSSTISNMKNDLAGLTESEASFLSTHVPSANPDEIISSNLDTNDEDTSTTITGPFEMEIDNEKTTDITSE